MKILRNNQKRMKLVLLLMLLLSLILQSSVFAKTKLKIYDLDENGNVIKETQETKETKKVTETKKQETTKAESTKEQVKEIVKEEITIKKEEPKKEVKKPELKWEEGQIVIYDENGSKITSRSYVLNGAEYLLDANGYAYKGLYETNGQIYYYDPTNGKKVLGWVALNDKFYYFNPETNGLLQKGTDILIEGTRLVTFAEDGSYLSEKPAPNANVITNPLGNIQINTALISKVKYVENSSKINKDAENVDENLKADISYILSSLPSQIIEKMTTGVNNIYICVNQAEGGREYIQRATYKDPDTKDTEEELIPFKANTTDIWVDGSVPEYLYYGIGAWLNNTMTYSGGKPSNGTTWTTIQKNKSEQLDSLLGLGDGAFRFFRANAEISMACAIGWYIYSPSQISSYCPSAANYIKGFIKLDTAGGPGAIK